MSQVFVTGAARSGTSLTAQLLQAHGGNLGSPINSLYENTGIREGILKPYLAAMGADPLGQRDLPRTYRFPPCPALHDRVLAHLKGRTPRVYKDAKLTLVWPIFAEAFPEAKWIIVRRDPDAIAASCLRAPFMTAYRDAAGWLRWVSEHERRFATMRAMLGTSVLEYWPDELMTDPSAFRPVATHAGLAYDEGAVRAIVDRKAWHHAPTTPPV